MFLVIFFPILFPEIPSDNFFLLVNNSSFTVICKTIIVLTYISDYFNYVDFYLRKIVIINTHVLPAHYGSPVPVINLWIGHRTCFGE